MRVLFLGAPHLGVLRGERAPALLLLRLDLLRELRRAGAAQARPAIRARAEKCGGALADLGRLGEVTHLLGADALEHPLLGRCGQVVGAADELAPDPHVRHSALAGELLQARHHRRAVGALVHVDDDGVDPVRDAQLARLPAEAAVRLGEEGHRRHRGVKLDLRLDARAHRFLRLRRLRLRGGVLDRREGQRGRQHALPKGGVVLRARGLQRAHDLLHRRRRIDEAVAALLGVHELQLAVGAAHLHVEVARDAHVLHQPEAHARRGLQVRLQLLGARLEAAAAAEADEAIDGVVLAQRRLLGSHALLLLLAQCARLLQRVRVERCRRVGRVDGAVVRLPEHTRQQRSELARQRLGQPPLLGRRHRLASGLCRAVGARARLGQVLLVVPLRKPKVLAHLDLSADLLVARLAQDGLVRL
mmetsp:Transcript_11356/g.23074  ORF Transcript_11356/g.23074 Transcript_11356/m.23074 type:complete len:417 (+) Transcript_11356:1-1251(+)